LIFQCAVVSSLFAGESAVTPDADVALRADAIVVARVGSVSAAPPETGGAASLWIERVLKGKLRGGRDIIWVSRKDVSAAQPDGKLWLVFLTQNGDGSWRVQKGKEAQAVENMQSPQIASAAKAAGSYGAAGEGEAPSAGELALWIKKAAKGSQKAKRDASAKLLAAGDAARSELLSALSSDEEDVAAVARTLLPLTGGGPAVNKLRLALEPGVLEVQSGDIRNVVVHFANLSDADMRFVLGQSAWGETIEAATSYRVRAMVGKTASDEARDAAPVLPATLPKDYGKPRTEGSASLPLIRTAPNLGTLPVAVRIEIEKGTVDGKENRLLKLPHGVIPLPGPGRYGVRVLFECPGPRPDQQKLIDANYWGGGRLISNEIVLVVK